MKIIMLGAPGAGKDTQAKKITVKYQIPHIPTGDIFRANIKNSTELGVEAKSYMDTGGFVPDEITIGMLLDRIHEEDCKNKYILDGLPRTIPQAESLTKTLGGMDETINYAVNVDVPDRNIIDRVSGRRACPSYGTTYHIVYSPPEREEVYDVCGQQLVLRDDDKPETIKKCLDVYHDQTRPLIKHHKKAGVSAEIDGTLGMERVFQTIVRILGA